MSFSSPVFIFLFLPVVLAGYWLFGKYCRTTFLLFASLFFYAWGDGRFILLLTVSAIANYVFGILIDNYRDVGKKQILLLWLIVLLNISVLIWFKYAENIVYAINAVLSKLNFSAVDVSTPHLPLGISFLTLQGISYVIDVYRQENEPQRNFFDFFLFMALFPKLIAGPIIRYNEVADGLNDRSAGLEFCTSGIKRFIIGLGKKVLIADTLAQTVDKIFLIPPGSLTSSVAWLGIICYTLQIYFDFSGYSDMAIGLGRLFGFNINENFNYPYASRSLTEFWRRWHISLSTWLRDYLFYPLSYVLVTENVRQKMALGKYKTNYRALLSIVIVFTVCGIWHGAGWTFIVWGLLHGLILAFESAWLSKVLKRVPTPFQHMYLLFMVMICWVFFRSPSLSHALAFLRGMFGLSGAAGIEYNLYLYLGTDLILAMIFGLLGMLPIARLIGKYGNDHPGYMPAIEVAGLIIILAGSFATMANSAFNPFIYQRF